MTVNREKYDAVKTMLKSMPTAKVTAFLMSLADDLAGAVAPERVVAWSCCANG